MNKWLKIIIIITIILCTILIIKNFMKTDYKKEESGNNKNIKEIEEYMLNINSYKAKIKVTVKSNKNVNFYELEQEVTVNKTKQIATSPEDLKGIEITYENGTLQIKNTQYNLSKIYNNYPYIANNDLFLTSFIEEYRQAKNKEIKEENNKIKMSFKSEESKYDNNKILYINKSTLKPENLKIFDINNDCKVDIVYNEIEFNI